MCKEYVKKKMFAYTSTFVITFILYYFYFSREIVGN